MEILVRPEQIYQLTPRFDMQAAKHKVEDKKLTLVAGTLGALISRPKPEEVVLTYSEQRLEPFWHVTAHVRTVYDRPWAFTIPIKNPEAKSVTTLGQDLNIAILPGGAHAIELTGIEHCIKEQVITHTYDRTGVLQAGLAELLSAPREAIANLASFHPESTLVLEPEAPAIGIIAKLLQEVAQPEQGATILEQRVEVTNIALYFKPVYAFEFLWEKKSKNVVIEFDGLSGEVQTGRVERRQVQLPHPELLFDVSLGALKVAIGTLGTPLPSAVALSIEKIGELVHN